MLVPPTLSWTSRATMPLVSPLTVWWTVGKSCRIGGRDSTVEKTSNEASGFRVQGDEPARGGRRHLRLGRPPAPPRICRRHLAFRPPLEGRGAVRRLHGRRHRLPRFRRSPPAARPVRPTGRARAAGARGG